MAVQLIEFFTKIACAILLQTAIIAEQFWPFVILHACTFYKASVHSASQLLPRVHRILSMANRSLLVIWMSTICIGELPAG
jgi:hypothetical protein